MNLPACRVEANPLITGDKWKVLILRDMEAKELPTRKVYAVVPPRVEYTLTDTGYSLKPVLDTTSHWCETFKARHEA